MERGVRCQRCHGFIDHAEAEHRQLECHCPPSDNPETDPRPEANPSPAYSFEEGHKNPTPGYGYRLGTGFFMMNGTDEYM